MGNIVMKAMGDNVRVEMFGASNTVPQKIVQVHVIRDSNETIISRLMLVIRSTYM